MPAPPGLRSKRSGHSLVELLISSSVLVIAIVGAFSSHVAGRRLMQESRDTAVATGILRANLDALLTRPLADVTSGVDGLAPGAVLPALPGPALRDQVLTLETPGWLAGAPAPEVLDVVLRLDWTGGTGRARSMRLATSMR